MLSSRIYSGILEPKSKLIFNYNPLEKVLRSYIEKKDKQISVYVLNLRNEAAMSINEDVEDEPASLNKKQKSRPKLVRTHFYLCL